MNSLSLTKHRRGRFMAALLGVAALALAPALVLLSGSAVAAGPCGPPVVNVIACENTQQGDPASDWQITGAGSHDDPGVRHLDERQRR